MIVALVGPIKHWWSCWDSEEHKRYVAWRQLLSDELVAAGHLVYRPHEAWKGQWDEQAQAINDVALRTAHVVLNLTPADVPSYGTDDEVDYARRYNKTILPAPPPKYLKHYKYLAKERAKLLAQDVKLQRESVDLATVARKLLWVIDGNMGTEQADDFIREARDALSVNTKER